MCLITHDYGTVHVQQNECDESWGGAWEEANTLFMKLGMMIASIMQSLASFSATSPSFAYISSPAPGAAAPVVWASCRCCTPIAYD